MGYRPWPVATNDTRRVSVFLGCEAESVPGGKAWWLTWNGAVVVTRASSVLAKPWRRLAFTHGGVATPRLGLIGARWARPLVSPGCGSLTTMRFRYGPF